MQRFIRCALIAALALLSLNALALSQTPINVAGFKASGGGGGPSDFVTDSYTEASDANLQSHTPEVGGTITLHTSYSGTVLVNGALDRIYLNTASTAAYYYAATPPSANYCVQADFTRSSLVANNVSITLGMDTSADTMVYLRLNDNGTTQTWDIGDRTTGSNNNLHSIPTHIPTVGGAAVTAKLCRSGTALTAFFDGVQDTNLNSTTTITATGKAGVRFSGTASSTTAIHIDNFSAR